MRRRFRVRTLLVVLVPVAFLLTLLRPWLAEPLRWGNRQLQVRVFQRPEIDRHTDLAGITGLARDFAEAVRGGRFEDARGLTTVAYRRRLDSSRWQALLEASPLRRSPCDLAKATCRFADEENRFVSTLHLDCGPKASAGVVPEVRLIVVTEAGQLRIDAIESPR